MQSDVELREYEGGGPVQQKFAADRNLPGPGLNRGRPRGRKYFAACQKTTKTTITGRENIQVVEQFVLLVISGHEAEEVLL